MGIIDGLGLHGDVSPRSYDPDTETYRYAESPRHGGFCVSEGNVSDVVLANSLFPAVDLYPSGTLGPYDVEEVRIRRYGHTGEQRGGRRPEPMVSVVLSGGYVPRHYLDNGVEF